MLSVTFHEAAHGLIAWRLGDDTAYRMGRLSFNPLRHVDFVGTVFLPAVLVLLQAPFLFGWAKPVPVFPHRLRSPRWGMISVALAGPTANIFLAVLAALLVHIIVHIPTGVQAWTLFNIQHAIQLNIMLALFNMIPIPPLDGGIVIANLLPRFLTNYILLREKYGILLLLTILLIVPTIGHRMGADWNLLTWLLGPLATFLHQLILQSAGLI